MIMSFLCFFYWLFYFLGPPQPRTLQGSVMVNLGDDLVLTGGHGQGNGGHGHNSMLYQLSCQNRICQWKTLSQQLVRGRNVHVAIPVPDDFVSCE